MTAAKHPPVVYVEWVDTAILSARWEDREQLMRDAEEYLAPITAAGFLLADEERGVILALGYNGHNDDAGQTIIIPRFAITRMDELMPGAGFTRDPA